jgi:hypothetical protein
MRAVLAAISLAWAAGSADAIELKDVSLRDLMPCRPAAAKYCDRAQGMTMSNLLRCGATLAANSETVGDRCRQVLRRYGQF